MVAGILWKIVGGDEERNEEKEDREKVENLSQAHLLAISLKPIHLSAPGS